MPRNSAFRKATKAITKTQKFFSYESPYLTSPVPASEACQGACCADVPTVPMGPSRVAASSPASARATTSSTALLAKASGRRAPDESGLDQLESDESESSDGNDDDNDIPDERGDDLCNCKTCVAARHAHVLQKCDPKRVAAVAAAKKAKGEQFGSSAKFPAWAAEMAQNAQLRSKGSGKHHIAGSLEELQDQLLAGKDLGDVVCWAAEKIFMLAVPLGDRALRQLMETLFESAEAGSKDRLEKNGVKKEVEAEQEEPLRDPATIESTVPSGEQSPAQLTDTPTTNAKANMAEKLKIQTMKTPRNPTQAFAGQCPPSETVNEKQGKALNTITRAPITDEEYEEVSARSFYFSGILPHFSRNDVVQLLRKYGEIEKCKLKLQSCNQKTCWLGFFTMVSSESADRARRDLHGRIMDGHALTVERPPDARMMRAVRAQLKNRTAAKPTPEPKKEPERVKPEHRVTLADKQYIVKRIRELGRSGMDEVLEIIERESTAVESISQNKIGVDIDYLSNGVLLKLLDFFENDVSCASDDSQSRSASPKPRALKKLKGVLAEHVLEVANDKSSQTEDIPAFEEELARKRKCRRAVTKWDLLRGLKSAAEEYLKVAIALADEQFERFTDPSVMNAPNLPTGAYSILRNGLLAENIGRLLVQLRDGNGQGDLDQSENIRAAVRDPVARRWKTLRRDFPDVPNMISKLNPIRDDLRAWVATGRHLAPRYLYVDAADEKSRAAITKALGDKNVHGLEDLAAFTRRLTEVDKDARFRLEKPGPAEVDPREAQWSEFLDLGAKTIERYPGLSRLIGLETRLPYHPNHEERHSEDEQCRKRPKGVFSTPTL